MTVAADRYRRIAAGLTARVQTVPADRWSDPSPCEGWTARDVLGHVVDTHRGMPRSVGIELEPGPTVVDDPAGAWASVRDQIAALLDDPARAELEYDGMFGRTSIGRTLDQFVTFDVLVHTWDIARATGLDEHLDPDEVAPVLEQAKGWGDAIRSPNVCGPEITPPAGADAQTRLLCFLGRRV